jgi:hypothetical protein
MVPSHPMQARSADGSLLRHCLREPIGIAESAEPSFIFIHIRTAIGMGTHLCVSGSVPD